MHVAGNSSDSIQLIPDLFPIVPLSCHFSGEMDGERPWIPGLLATSEHPHLPKNCHDPPGRRTSVSYRIVSIPGAVGTRVRSYSMILRSRSRLGMLFLRSGNTDMRQCPQLFIQVQPQFWPEAFVSILTRWSLPSSCLPPRLAFQPRSLRRRI